MLIFSSSDLHMKAAAAAWIRSICPNTHFQCVHDRKMFCLELEPSDASPATDADDVLPTMDAVEYRAVQNRFRDVEIDFGIDMC